MKIDFYSIVETLTYFKKVMKASGAEKDLKANAAKYTPVAQMMIWNDVIKKEGLKSSIYDKYTINMNSLYIISEKPTNMPRFDDEELTEADQQFLDATKKKVEDRMKTPKMKYPYPRTANQEIGWVPGDKFNKQFINNRKISCKESEFSSCYVQMKGYGPYSNKNNNEFQKKPDAGDKKK